MHFFNLIERSIALFDEMFSLLRITRIKSNDKCELKSVYAICTSSQVAANNCELVELCVYQFHDLYPISEYEISMYPKLAFNNKNLMVYSFKITILQSKIEK